MLKPVTLKKGTVLSFNKDYEINKGSSYPLRVIPEGVHLNSVEFKEGSFGKIGRSAGVSVYLVNKYKCLGNKILLRFPSEEEYLINCNNVGTIGRLDNLDHHINFLKKAGDNRRKGIRPCVRGTAMNPVDHPHGGNTTKGRHPQSPWGKLTKGPKTRKKLNFG